MKRVAGLLAVALLAALVAQPMAAHAATEAERQREIQEEIERLREELDEVAADEADVLAELRVTQRRKALEEARLGELDRAMTGALAELEVAQSKLDATIAAELEARRRLEDAQSKLYDAHEQFRDQVVAAYIHNTRFDAPAFARDPDRIGELGTQRALVDALNEKQAELIEQLEVLERDTAALEAEAEAKRAAAASQRDEVEARTSGLEQARAAQLNATSTVSAEADRERSLLESLRGRRADYERRIRQQQIESDAIADLLRRRGNGGVRISGRGSLSAPLANPVVTSTYGYRIHPIFGDRRLHTGLDFRAPTGVPLLAGAPGEVLYAGWRSGYGNTTIIDHGGGVATLYAHQSSLLVAAGDEVRRGERIGLAGMTGYATGPHLHFEVRVNGAPVDPLPYL